MFRRNPEVERLELIVAGLKRDLEERRRDPGDHGCAVRAPRGMATNGGCRCDERDLRYALRWWKRKAAFLEETIRDMVAERGELRAGEEEGV